MAIPDYQSLMLPLVELASDKGEVTFSDALETLATRFSLTEEDRKVLLPSGRQPTFENRAGWGVTYLAKAGLLERTGRGKFRITERGRKVLEDKPDRLTAKSLEAFPEFQEFKGGGRQTSATSAPATEPFDGQTLEEVLESTYQQLRKQLAAELLETVKRSTPRFFEQLVVDLLVAMGYGGSRRDAGQAVGQSGDGGVDGMIKEDRLGLDTVYIQAKRWDGAVGRPVVQGFAGSLEGFGANKGVLITTSYFTQDARSYVDRIQKRIVLVDGEQLAELMIDHNVGVTQASVYPIKKLDSDYFGES